MDRLPALIALTCAPAVLFAQAVNDEPCTALHLTVNAECAFIQVDNTEATFTTSVPVPDCGALSNADLWYTITVPVPGFLRIDTESGTMTDAAMAIYTAPSCTGPFTLIACDDDSGLGTMPLMQFSSLSPDSTLYLRLWGYGNAVGDLGLCAHAPLMLPPGDCTYVLEMTDGSGNGWGTGARVGHSINGAAFVEDSLEFGAYAMRLIGVNVGDEVVLNYTAGSFNNENGVTLRTMVIGPSLYTGSNMATSAELFSDVADCGTPPSPPGDCGHAAPLCGDTLFPQGALTNGYSVDLTPENQGCLLAGERQGLWTRFNVATDGTLAFTLSPSGPSDFDFAIWGPLDSLVCPPAGEPVRCSWSALAAPTGLSSAALDNSEIAGGDGWVNDLDVIAGQRYLLYIDNFSVSSLPVNLTWQLSDGASLLCPPAPEAQFLVIPPLIQPAGSVTFIDQSTNDPSAWSWSFPGGTPSSSTEQDPVGITFDQPGCHDVTLTAYNAGGQGSTTQVCAVQVDVGTGLFTSPINITLLQDASGITVRSTDGGGTQVHLLDATGRSLLHRIGRGQVHLATGGLSTGQYLLLVTSENGTWSRRVFITD